ncbi:MAG TPA: hypothetical protein ENJ31_13210, partial [Anaerolineae bacterium]|nr:hypothetical protein [Anaerolineae bacterium]
MFRKSTAVWAALLMLILAAPLALAQDYSFNVQENRVHVYINGDGTVEIVYDITFANDPGAHPIDVVDIGFPNDSFDLNQVRA